MFCQSWKLNDLLQTLDTVSNRSQRITRNVTRPRSLKTNNWCGDNREHQLVGLVGETDQPVYNGFLSLSLACLWGSVPNDIVYREPSCILRRMRYLSRSVLYSCCQSVSSPPNNGHRCSKLRRDDCWEYGWEAQDELCVAVVAS